MQYSPNKTVFKSEFNFKIYYTHLFSCDDISDFDDIILNLRFSEDNGKRYLVILTILQLL